MRQNRLRCDQWPAALVALVYLVLAASEASEGPGTCHGTTTPCHTPPAETASAHSTLCSCARSDFAWVGNLHYNKPPVIHRHPLLLPPSAPKCPLEPNQYRQAPNELHDCVGTSSLGRKPKELFGESTVLKRTCR
jgi:hypothetical protein